MSDNARQGEEIGWLVEIPEFYGGPVWWTGSDYTRESTEALRFARKQDAEKMIDAMGGGSMVATEHKWVASS